MILDPKRCYEIALHQRSGSRNDTAAAEGISYSNKENALVG